MGRQLFRFLDPEVIDPDAGAIAYEKIQLLAFTQ
jgi:hypothetical protein